MDRAKIFYERYWERRIKEHRLYGKDGVGIPKRFFLACEMILSRQRQETMSVLDLGCGDGTLGRLLRDQLQEKVRLMGMDISANSVDMAKPYYDEVRAMDFESEEFFQFLWEQEYDWVVCLEVIEHLFDPLRFLQKVREAVRDNGYLIASFPNIAWWRYRLDLLRGEFPRGYSLFEPAEHLQHFTRQSFSCLLKKAGFSSSLEKVEFRFPAWTRNIPYLRRCLGRFPGLFGYQIVIQAQPVSCEDSCEK